MLAPDEVRQLSRLNSWVSSAWWLADGILIAGTFSLPVFFPNPLVYIIALVLMARNQLALALIMHEGVHQRLFARRDVNNYLTQLFACAPIFMAFESYQKNHLKHHQVPLTSEDPDITLTGGYPIDRSSFIRKLARDICGISYFKFFRYFLYGSHRRHDAIVQKKSEPSRGHTIPLWFTTSSIAGFNALLFLVLWRIDHPWLYLILWILPSVTVLQVLLRIRGIAEHAGYKPTVDQKLCTRTIDRISWQTFFFAPHFVHFHIEHHLYVSIPFYRLRKVHKLLSARGTLPKQNVYHGYGQLLHDLVIPVAN